jgi:hypothetical protein
MWFQSRSSTFSECSGLFLDQPKAVSDCLGKLPSSAPTHPNRNRPFLSRKERRISPVWFRQVLALHGPSLEAAQALHAEPDHLVQEPLRVPYHRKPPPPPGTSEHWPNVWIISSPSELACLMRTTMTEDASPQHTTRALRKARVVRELSPLRKARVVRCATHVSCGSFLHAVKSCG